MSVWRMETSDNPVKAESFLRLYTNFYTDVDNRERAWARDKKKGDEKEGEEMHENFCSGGEKMRNGE